MAPDRETMPVIRKKDREYMGMFEYDRREEGTIIKVLIYGKKSRVFRQLCLAPFGVIQTALEGISALKSEVEDLGCNLTGVLFYILA